MTKQTELPLKGKVALVTGSSRHDNLGFAIAKELAMRGAAIVLSGSPGSKDIRCPARVDELVEYTGKRFHTYATGDLSKGHEMRRIVNLTADHRRELFGKRGVDIFVTAAGTFSASKGKEHNMDMFYHAPKVGHEVVIELAKVNDAGAWIVHVTSHAGTDRLPAHLRALQTNYATPKRALNDFVRAESNRHSDYGITVGAIANGSTKTGGLEGELNTQGIWSIIKESTGLSKEEYLTSILQPQDIAKVANGIISGNQVEAWEEVYRNRPRIIADNVTDEEKRGPVIYMPSINF